MGTGTKGYERIPELMALLMSDKYIDDDGQPMLTVRKISEITGFPVTLVQRDVAELASNLYIGGCFFFADYSEYEDDEAYANAADDTDKKTGRQRWIAGLKSGDAHACDERFYIDKELFWKADVGNDAPVNLSPFEKNVFAKVMHRSDISDAVWVKESFTSLMSDKPKMRDTLLDIIQSSKLVTFTYDEWTGEEFYEDFNPVCIYETVENGRLYLVGFDSGGTLHLKRPEYIREVHIQEEDAQEPDPESMEILDYMWGADLNNNDKADVKIKIFNNTSNIIAKIKAVADGRKYAKLYPEEENDAVWYYEDTVCGMNSFKRWLRSFGASVVALEPLKLAEDMYRSSVRRLERYESVIVE